MANGFAIHSTSSSSTNNEETESFNAKPESVRKVDIVSTFDFVVPVSASIPKLEENSASSGDED